jgi:two-component system phosphate regulon sensor histidine kinase PhoR
MAPLPLTFRTKLLASHVGLVIAVVLIAILELNQSLVADLHRQLDERLVEQAHGAAQWVSEGRKHPDKLAGRLALIVKADVTIYDRAGSVVGDASEGAAATPATAAETEVETAHHGGVGLASRARPGTGDEMRYVAVPAADGLVLRLGAPLSDIHGTVLAMQRRLLFASLLAVVAALALGWFASQLAARPLRAMTASATRIARGDYDIDLPSRSPDEFGILSRSLVSLAAQLKARIGDLTAERDRLTAILAGMAEGVIVLDAGHQVIVANPAAGAILDADGALVGRALDATVADPTLRAFIEQGARGAETHETELETAGGKSVALYVRPLAAATGGGFVTVLRDMTGVRRLMTMRRDFVANVSHELRTPIAAIQGYAETLLDGGADAATSRQFLEIVHRKARRLGALVQDLLTLSELEARPSGHAVRERVTVAAIAQHVVETVRARAEASGARVVVAVDPAAVVLGDPTAIEQVIENLVGNAVKYGDPGGAVKIRGERRGARVVLDVEDDGPGIAREHLPRIFERFYRVDAGRSRERGGTGLGLAIVKHLVEAMGGAGSVESELGRGTRFRVELPAG